MRRDTIDHEGFERADIKALRETGTPPDMPFRLGKISHVVLKVADLERSVAFYTQVLGMRISDVYPETMMPGRMVFLRYNDDHHGVALVGGATCPASGDELHHFAFEVDSLDALFQAREHLDRHGVELSFEGRRRAGQQVALEFRDPDGHNLEICWGIDLIAPGAAARPPEGWVTAATLEEAMANAPEGQAMTLQDTSLLRTR